MGIRALFRRCLLEFEEIAFFYLVRIVFRQTFTTRFFLARRKLRAKPNFARPV